MPFEEFADVRRRVDRAPRLGVQSKGRLSLNPAAIDILGKPSHVVLLFDKDALRLGVRGAAPKEPHAYRLIGTGKATEARTASLVALLNHFGLDGDLYVGSYQAEEERAGGHVVLAISLREHGRSLPLQAERDGQS